MVQTAREIIFILYTRVGGKMATIKIEDLNPEKKPLLDNEEGGLDRPI